MYRIGQFSNITKVTVKALRFYEESGLIKPAFIDPSNGYRYFSSDQLPVMHKIVSLRQCGFSIPEIKQMLEGHDLPRLLSGQKQKLESELTEKAAQLASINSYLDFIKEDTSMKYQIVIKTLPRVIVYCMRTVVKSYDSYFELIPGIGKEICAANPGLKCIEDPPYCFIIYHDGEYKDHDIDIEFCEAVYESGVETENIKFKTIDAVPRAACILHKGPYSTLSRAYSAVYKWIEDNNYIPGGNPRESYIDGIWNQKDPADWLTEVQVPLFE